MARPRKITVTDRADMAKSRMADIASRNPKLAARLAGNVHGAGNKTIPLKEPARWQTYCENTYADENAFYDMKQLGWEPLRADDLACTVEESGFRLNPEGYLVRGEHGREMLFKMDKDDYAYMMQMKTDANMRGIGSAKKIKADMAEAAAAQFGDEGGQFVHDMPGQVVDTLVGGNR